MNVLSRGSQGWEGRRVDGAVLAAAGRAREAAERARGEAERIVAEARVEAAGIREAAAQAGQVEGAGRAAALLATAAAERARLLAGLDVEVGALALDVARRILGDAVAADRGVITSLAARALEAFAARPVVVLRVNPVDAPAFAPDRCAALPVGPGLELVSDPGVARGALVVEAGGARLDASVEAQLAAFERALAEARS